MAGDFVLAWSGDTLYRLQRIAGKDGFVTFRRLPAKWAQMEKHAEPAAPATPAKAGLLHHGFLAALALAVAGACVGERMLGVPSWDLEARSVAGMLGWGNICDEQPKLPLPPAALGGTAAVQQYCSANGYVIYGSGVSQACRRLVAGVWRCV